MIALARQPLDRGDERALDLADRHLARTHRRAVDIDGARAAIAGAAPVFGAGEVGRVAQGPEQGCLGRSEEHTSELQSLMRISYAVFCLKKKKTNKKTTATPQTLTLIKQHQPHNTNTSQ